MHKRRDCGEVVEVEVVCEKVVHDKAGGRGFERQVRWEGRR